MDQLDEAQQIEERERQAAIDAARVTGNEVLTGKCQWCDEFTQGVFCSAECRNDKTKHDRMHGL